MFITIGGKRYYLWRSVDQDGDVLDIFIQKRRDKRVAKAFFRKLLKRECQILGALSPTSCAAIETYVQRYTLCYTLPRRTVEQLGRGFPSTEPAEERRMRRFKSHEQGQHFLSAHGLTNNLFRVGHHLLKSAHYLLFQDRSFATWLQVNCAHYST